MRSSATFRLSPCRIIGKIGMQEPAVAPSERSWLRVVVVHLSKQVYKPGFIFDEPLPKSLEVLNRTEADHSRLGERGQRSRAPECNKRFFHAIPRRTRRAGIAHQRLEPNDFLLELHWHSGYV